MSVRLTREALRPERAWSELGEGSSGGVTFFAGRVRADSTPAGKVSALFYDSDRRMALRAMARLVEDARRKFGAERVLLWHRLGTLPVGSVAVVVGVATGHRHESFRAARFLIDELKERVPIWKHDVVEPAGRQSRTRSRRKPISR